MFARSGAGGKRGEAGIAPTGALCDNAEVPELPEVETVVRALRPLVQGRTLRRVARVDAPAGPKYEGLERAKGQRVEDVRRRGKFILMPLGSGDTIVVHLGMTGTFGAERPRDHVRVEMVFAGGSPARLYFRDPRRFGRFVVVEGEDFSRLPTLAALGPEPLDPAFTAAALGAVCVGRTTGMKALLLGQRAVAGLGNIYVDEALFAAGIHPETPAGAVPGRRLRLLRDAIVEILGRAIEAGGTTLRDYRQVSGESGGNGVNLQVYGRGGTPCVRCGADYVVAEVAQRTTTWCPRCQRRR